jgi:hypothetical protein
MSHRRASGLNRPSRGDALGGRGGAPRTVTTFMSHPPTAAGRYVQGFHIERAGPQSACARYGSRKLPCTIVRYISRLDPR